jgi:multiple sugar transport system permease protein
MLRINKSLDWPVIIARLLLLVMLCFTVLPLVFMFTASLMNRNQILRMPYSWIPKPFQFSNFLQALQGNDSSWIFPKNILNSLVVSSVVSCTTVILAALTG